jgi:hypothetical protein
MALLRQRQRPNLTESKKVTHRVYLPSKHSMSIRIPWSNRRCEASGQPAHRWYRRWRGGLEKTGMEKVDCVD